MKFIHLSDLHIGKRFNERNIIADQEYILEQILSVIQTEAPDAVLIAGDIYDRAVPPAEAVTLFDSFLTRLAGMGMQTFIISGNHDSAERTAFACGLIERSGVHISRLFDGHLQRFTLPDPDGSGNVDIFLLPYVRPSEVRSFYPDEEIPDVTAAIDTVIQNSLPDEMSRSILVAHLYAENSAPSGSESAAEIIGGEEPVSAGVFKPFSYTALGHIHSPQNVNENIRYCGAPLKYDFSEDWQEKSVTVGEMDGDGKVNVRTVPLKPLHEVKRVTGLFADLMQSAPSEDFTEIILDDKEKIDDAAARLRTRFANCLSLRYKADEERRKRLEAGTASGGSDAAKAAKLTPADLFSELYACVFNEDMSKEESDLLNSIIKELTEQEENGEKKETEGEQE